MGRNAFRCGCRSARPPPGRGLLDLAAYDDYLHGRMTDSGLSDADLATALAAVPVV
ncbi:hypothetical protein ACIB24_12795 [Spongisporangium articulatum]|uniref:Uncharacterized protein n=1 Tax=Spongisporangium articulatum TaxID=3362603 RepID=A0ABW8APA3_9ACTN